MTSAGYIFTINLSIAILFALAFAAIGVQGRAYRSALYFAVAFVLGGFGVFTELLLPIAALRPLAPLFYVLGFAAYLGLIQFLVIGVSCRIGAETPLISLGVIFVVSVALNATLIGVDRDSAVRLFAYQLPFAASLLIGSWMALTGGKGETSEKIIGAAFALGVVQYLSKPVIAYYTGGTGATSADYAGTDYAAWSQMSGAILGVMTGLLFVLLYMWDMVSDKTHESLTDGLSGLLNRRGFEQRAGDLLGGDVSDTRPAALITCDLDHFKQVNDTHGHAAGDRVLVGFAGLLRDACGKGSVVGRIGGEEFCILLDSANLASARAFAEALRENCSQLWFRGLPAGFSATCSFGVAERRPGDSLSSLMSRADRALYEAKRAGRNRVMTEAAGTADRAQAILKRAEERAAARVGS